MTEKIRIIAESGCFDLEKPADFVFGVFVGSIRSQGYFLNDKIYQPADRIVTIFLYDDEASDVVMEPRRDLQ